MAILLMQLHGTAITTTPYVNVPSLGVAFGTLFSNDSSIAVFNGLKYGAPPVGAGRFASSTPAGPLSTVAGEAYNATAYGDFCWQPESIHLPPGNMNEDCLFLNVAGPLSALNASASLPVAFWIHGGSYNSGMSNLYHNFAMASAAHTASEPMIVVTTNYRLNSFGFLASPAIANVANPATKSAGNFGIEDQRLALRWVHDHIAAFGGDPSRVTIFGESAGGNSVLNHLAQPASGSLFHRAIIESGVYNSGGKTMVDATAQFMSLLTIAPGCDVNASATEQIKCLRALNASTLRDLGEKAQHNPSCVQWLPVIDGVSMSAAPTALIEAGKYHSEVPVLMGSNRDEMAFFLILAEKFYPANLTEADFDAALASAGNAALGPPLKKIYDPAQGGTYVLPPVSKRGNFSKWWWILMRTETDTVWGLGACAHRALARALLKGGTPSVHVYLFAHPSQTDSFGGAVPGLIGKGTVVVPHASEIPFVYSDATQLTPGEEATLATEMGAYFTRFIVAAADKMVNPTPRGTRFTKWPAYDPTADEVLRFDVASAGGIVVQQGLRKTACDFFDAHKKPDPKHSALRQ